MKINIAITDWDENHPSYNVLLDGAEAIINGCRETLDIPSEAVQELWLADFEHFPSTVEHLVPREGYKEDGLTVAIGKAIPVTHTDGSLSTIVVLQAKIITDLLNTFHGSEQTSNVEILVAPDYGLYCICHELGHCKDHFVRTERIKTSFHDDPRFWIANYANNQVSYLAAEFAASVHSAMGMSADIFRIENEHFTSILSTAQDELEIIRKPATTREKLNELGPKAPYIFWLILIEYAKLFGNLLGNENLEDLPVDYWITCNNETKTILEEFQKILVKLWNEYPNWTFDTFSPVVQLWGRLANANGFNFVHTEAEDKTYWRSGN